MSLYDTLQQALTPEQFTTITDALGDDFDYDQVPRARLNKVIKQRNEARNSLKALEGGKQPPKGGTKCKHSDDDDDDDDTNSVDIEELTRRLQSEKDDAVNQVRIQYAALDKLRAAGIQDPDIVWSSNLLDKTKIKFGADGTTLEGLDDMLKTLKTDRPNLFKQDEPGVRKGTGKEGGNEFEGVTTREAFLKLPAEKQIAFKQANPDAFKSFLKNN